jgi:type II secretory pathway pseudopilin PulG
MSVVILLIGIVMAFAIPSVRGISMSNKLKGAAENIAAQLRLAREKAIATGTDQTMVFALNDPPGTDYDYRISNSPNLSARWELPRDITYYSIGVNPTMKRDGRASASGLVVLQDRRGNRDTVSVQLSGLVLVK